MSGLRIHGHVFRFAACQFGQKTAGSPLNSVVMSVARYFGRLPDPIHVAAWVDDLHFSMRTPPHPPCAGFVGGCTVCVATHKRAVAAEALWHTKAQRLNLPRAPGKGHSAAQGGAFTGVHIDTFLDQYSMLPDKLDSLNQNFGDLSAVTVASPRILARTRGKALHYGCAVQYLRPVCASLTQAIHQAEQVGAPPPPELAQENQVPDFDWDQTLAVSTRTHAAVACLRLALHQFGTCGQPLWPTPPSSLYGQFLASPPAPTAPMVLTAFAFPSGWGFSLRAPHDSHGFIKHGHWTDAAGLLTANWMSPGPADSSGAPLGYAQSGALACLLSLHAASQIASLNTHPLLIRCASEEALTALCRGAPHCPALQDISMLFQTACILLAIPQPAFLVTPDGLLTRPAPSNAAQLASLDTSAPELRAIAHSLAESMGAAFTLDLFATQSNAITPRYYSQWPELATEAVDALAQADWGQSFCPHCTRMQTEFVFLYPPFGLVKAALHKARHDQARGVMVVPYAPASTWWPAILPPPSLHKPSRPQPPRLSCCPKHVLNQSNSAGHYITIALFDFRQDTSHQASSCIHMHTHRGPSRVRSTTDTTDAASILARLHKRALL
jgi:hypothetical protein